MMKWGIILVITIGLLVGISSGSFVNEPTTVPTTIDIGEGWFYPIEPVNFSDFAIFPDFETIYLYDDIHVPPAHEIPFGPVPTISISKDEAYASLIKGSENKWSNLLTLKYRIFF
jgi:hypothetical protein